MDSYPEGNMPVRSSLKVEVFGMIVCPRVHVRGRYHGHDPVALLHANAAKLNVLPHVAWLRELHRRDEAQKLLDC